MSAPKEGILALLLLLLLSMMIVGTALKVVPLPIVALVTTAAVAAVGRVVAVVYHGAGHAPLDGGHHALLDLHLLVLAVPGHGVDRVGELVDSHLPRVQQALQGSEEKKTVTIVVVVVVVVVVRKW